MKLVDTNNRPLLTKEQQVKQAQNMQMQIQIWQYMAQQTALIYKYLKDECKLNIPMDKLADTVIEKLKEREPKEIKFPVK